MSKKKAEPKKSKGGSTIHTIVEDGDMAAFTAILASDATIVAKKNGDGWTALHMAAYCGELLMLQTLLSAKSDINARCNDGCTPVHYASAQGHDECISALAAAGAKLDIDDNDGDSPLAVSQNKRIKKLLTELLKAAAEAGGDDDDDKAAGGAGAGDDEDEDEDA